jgi:hypothetical protein
MVMDKIYYFFAILVGFKYNIHMQKFRDDFGYNAGELANGETHSTEINHSLRANKRVHEWSTVFAV